MKSLVGICLSLVILGCLGLTACESPPSLPLTPSISFNSVEYRPDDATFRDTIVLTINFQDGDGDLGLGDGPRFNEPPYHPFNFVVNDQGESVTLRTAREANVPFATFIRDESNGNSLVELGSSDELPPLLINGTRNEREYLFPVYIGINGIDSIRTDTAFIQPNPNFSNITVDFLVQQSDGSFEEFDLVETFGLNFDGRFPILNDPERPIEGTLTYRIVSAFRIVPELRSQAIKLRVQIKDRSLNRSNTIETSVFNLGG